MAYTPTSWTNGTTPVNATNMNHLETQYTEATHSYEQFFINGFVLTGFAATKDGTTASQLDVTAGTAYLKQADGTLRSQSPTSSTQSCLGHPSTTLYLFLNNDGTWTFGTSSSGPANSLPICQVTTDASANILTVTATRPTIATLWPLMDGTIATPKGLQVGTSVTSIGGQATTGPFGVPVVVARAVEVNITTTTLTAVLSYTPTAAGLFRICASFCCNNGGTNKPLLHIDNTGGSHGQTSSVSMTSPTGAVYDGSSTTVTANFDMATTPQVFYCAGGAAIILRYQNSTGTPNDFVSFVIEQL